MGKVGHFKIWHRHEEVAHLAEAHINLAAIGKEEEAKTSKMPRVANRCS